MGLMILIKKCFMGCMTFGGLMVFMVFSWPDGLDGVVGFMV